MDRIELSKDKKRLRMRMDDRTWRGFDIIDIVEKDDYVSFKVKED